MMNNYLDINKIPLLQAKYRLYMLRAIGFSISVPHSSRSTLGRSTGNDVSGHYK